MRQSSKKISPLKKKHKPLNIKLVTLSSTLLFLSIPSLSEALPLTPTFFEESATQNKTLIPPSPVSAIKKRHYLNHFKSLLGTIEIEDGALSIRDDLRLQANRIYLKNTEEGGKLVAHGNVMVSYNKKTVVCDYFEYDENSDTCLLTNGKFSLYPWYVGGSTIILTPETLIVNKGYVSTSEGPKKDIVLVGDSLEFNSDNILSIGATTLKVKNLPIMAFPTFSFMPLEIPKPPINFRGGSGGFLGSYLGINYSPVSKKHLSSTLLLDSFFKHGIGVGCNFHYSPPLALSKDYIDLKSYYAHRLAIDMAETHDRYRVNGRLAFFRNSQILQACCHITDSWETVSDIFPKDFDLKNTGPTQIVYSWKSSPWTGLLRANFKPNKFLSVNKELPSLNLRYSSKSRSLETYSIRYISDIAMQAGYHSFSFSENIPNAKNFSSLRYCINPHLYAPLPIFHGVLVSSLNPSLIYCSSNSTPFSQHKWFGGIRLNVNYKLTLKKDFSTARHILEPFLQFSGQSRPLLKNNEHNIFSVQDTFYSISSLSIGLNSTLIPKSLSTLPALKAYLNFDAILNNCPGRPLFPKISGQISLPTGRHSHLFIDSKWLIKKSCWDLFNARWQWAFNENFALSTEFSHRSPYSWKKCNPYNMVLDASMTPEELLLSPLSDKHNTLLARVFIRPHPCWNLKISLRSGWARKNSPNYLEYQAILGTKIFEHWQLYSVYEKREADTRCYFFLKLDHLPTNRDSKKNW